MNLWQPCKSRDERLSEPAASVLRGRPRLRRCRLSRGGSPRSGRCRAWLPTEKSIVTSDLTGNMGQPINAHLQQCHAAVVGVPVDGVLVLGLGEESDSLEAVEVSVLGAVEQLLLYRHPLHLKRSKCGYE